MLEAVTDPAALSLLGMAAHAVGEPVRSVDFLGRAETKMREQGRLGLLSQVPPPDQEQARQHKVHAMFFVVAQDPRALASLGEMTDAKELRTVVSQTFPLAHGRQAYESAGHNRPPGKTVLAVR